MANAERIVQQYADPAETTGFMVVDVFFCCLISAKVIYGNGYTVCRM